MKAQSSPAAPPRRPPAGVVRRLQAAGCVFAADEARLLVSAAGTPEHLATLVDRRVAGAPLEHVLGWAEFCGLRIAVGPGVFVPRPRTELLVRAATAAVLSRPTARPRSATGGPPAAVVVDLCCGSGAVGAAVATGAAAAQDRVELHAVDVDPAAVECARRNVAAFGGRVYAGDLYAPLPTRLLGRVDVLVANAPYVPTTELPLLPAEARLHEPPTALDGGPDGLDVLRRIVAGAPQWLAPGGRVLVETSQRQAQVAAAALARHGLRPRTVRSDRLDATVVAGRETAGTRTG